MVSADGFLGRIVLGVRLTVVLPAECLGGIIPIIADDRYSKTLLSKRSPMGCQHIKRGFSYPDYLKSNISVIATMYAT